MAPAMILFVVFVLYPIFYIFNASMYDWDGINEAIFIGLQNYIEMFTDDRAFAVSIRNSTLLDISDDLPADVPGLHPGVAFLTSGLAVSRMPFASSSSCRL